MCMIRFVFFTATPIHPANTLVLSTWFLANTLVQSVSESGSARLPLRQREQGNNWRGRICVRRRVVPLLRFRILSQTGEERRRPCPPPANMLVQSRAFLANMLVQSLQGTGSVGKGLNLRAWGATRDPPPFDVWGVMHKSPRERRGATSVPEYGGSQIRLSNASGGEAAGRTSFRDGRKDVLNCVGQRMLIPEELRLT